MQVLGPLAGNSLFNEDDFKLLENFDMDLYARKVRNQVDADHQLKRAYVFLYGKKSIFDLKNAQRSCPTTVRLWCDVSKGRPMSDDLLLFAALGGEVKHENLVSN